MTDAETPPRPALRTLQRQQAELVDHQTSPMTGLGCSLRHGFDSRSRLIRWYQAATVRTFGKLCERWPPSRLLSDRTLLQACITSENRRAWASSRPITDEAADAHRRVLEEYALLPAAHDAFNILRRMAGEYIGDDSGPVTEDFDPTEQNLAMRPAFSRKDREQRRALERLWDGFESKDAIRTWLHELDTPTNGGLDTEWAPKVMRDKTAIDHLLRGRVQPSQAQRWREWLAITQLLPAFRKGIAQMDAGELAKRTPGGLEVGHA